MVQPRKNYKEENNIIISWTNIVMSEEMASYEFKMPTSILLDKTDEDLVIKWTKCKQQFKTFLLAAGLEQKSENRKAAILLNCLGEQVKDLYYNVLNGSEENQKYIDVIRLQDDYFLNKANEIIQTFKFNKRNQFHGESFDAYLSDLKKMIKQCNFGAVEERLLRENLVMEVSEAQIKIFLGMVNYLRKFINNLADLVPPLQLLLKQNTTWLWTDLHENTFNNIKTHLSKAPVLQNFDSSLPITIQCDASKDGLGCCLMQNNKPVSYSSRSLTNAEKIFSQIEKELLSVVWANKKFHYYVYGRPCTILNNHKPLETILKKSIHEIPSIRLQRLKLKLLKYDITFQYLKGKLMYIADLLSRSYLDEIDED
ncbi:unnamed protein product [Parnassius mnemosyne]|uniref:RNA-directed DNA polymerase n=1 Tax=Parnassius mnemosyne TaxID=213953 RepID=A0AAV1LSK8_9NEOP